MRDVFLVFLRLGMTSFGGPIAHLGYFRREFVERQAWIDEDRFSRIVAFCSILPGPTSSQVGMIVGLQRAGPGGALAAWLGFTLPSALALTLAAALLTGVHGATRATPLPWFDGLLAGLMAAVTAVVAQAVLILAKTQCPDRPTQTIAVIAGALAVAFASEPGSQWIPIAAGALAGAIAARLAPANREPTIPMLTTPIVLRPASSITRPRTVAIWALALFAALLAGTVVFDRPGSAGAFLATIVRAGGLVFGGGHVVLPLLQTLVSAHLIGARDFYAGYGLTQAMPGPLFTFAAFLGYLNRSGLHGPLGAAVATGLIFAPSFLLVFICLPLFDALRSNRAVGGALRGASAAVVGLLGALLYSPLLIGLESSAARIVLALAAFALIAIWRVAPWIAVVFAALAGAAIALTGNTP